MGTFLSGRLRPRARSPIDGATGTGARNLSARPARPGPHPERGTLAIGTTEKGGLAVVLAAVGGFVDAVGYLTLFHVYVGQMSGNSVSFGVEVGQRHGSRALVRGVPVGLFVLGVALGVAVIEVLRRSGRRRTASVLLCAELGLLAAYLVVGTDLLERGLTVGSGGFYLLLGFAVTAMALQTAALQRVGGQTVHTTYVTGMLTHLAEEGVRYLFLLRDGRRGRRTGDGGDPPSRARVLLLGALWIGYASGAGCGGWLEPQWNLRALIVPMVAVAAVLVVDLVKPLAPRGIPRMGPADRG